MCQTSTHISSNDLFPKLQTQISNDLLVTFTQVFFLRFYLFIHERERQRPRQKEKQGASREPYVGLDPGTPGSHPEPKADAQLLSHPGIPHSSFFFFFPHSGIFKRHLKLGQNRTLFFFFITLPFIHLRIRQLLKPEICCISFPLSFFFSSSH